MEREVIYNHLFNNRSFQNRIRPIVNEYQHKWVLICQGFHLYSCTSGSPSIPSANNSPSTNNSPSINIPPSVDKGIQGRVSVEIHDRYDNKSLDPYYTLLDEGSGSKKHPIIVLDVEKITSFVVVHALPNDIPWRNRDPENPDESHRMHTSEWKTTRPKYLPGIVLLLCTKSGILGG